MVTIIDFFSGLVDTYGEAIFVPIIIFSLVGIGAQWLFYEKCRQPGHACVIPFWNVVVFLKIVGRPWWHNFFVTIPPIIAFAILVNYPLNPTVIGALSLIGAGWFAFIVKVYIEICNSFGKNSILDYVLIIVFNGFYILNLGLSNDARYKGPVYNQSRSKKTVLA